MLYPTGRGANIKNQLRHERIKNAMKYTSMIHSEQDKFEVTTPTIVEEAKALSVRSNNMTEKDGMMLFRTPKGSVL